MTYISVLAQLELAKNDKRNLEEIEELQADMVKTSNEIPIISAGHENRLKELEVS